MTEVIRPIEAGLPAAEVRARLESAAPWFYDYRFSDGTSTDVEDELARSIHLARAVLIFPLLDRMFEARWRETRCLDLACHEGWFAVQLALRGAREVLAIDVRPQHVAKARMIKELGGLEALRVEQGDLFDLTPERVGVFDLVLFLGTLYHLDNPLQALRVLHAVTRGVAVIETQVVREDVELEVRWGSGEPRKGPALALVDADETHVEGEKPLVFVPTLDALYLMLHRVGFDRIYLSVPTPELTDQYVTYDRVVVIAS